MNKRDFNLMSYIDCPEESRHRVVSRNVPRKNVGYTEYAQRRYIA
jgi:hypothetical protein